MASSAKHCQFIVKDSRFLVKQWLDGSVVFDRQFGDTHALDPAAAVVFLSFMKGEREPVALMAALSPLYPDATIQDMTSRLDGLIAQLSKLGLVKEDFN